MWSRAAGRQMKKELGRWYLIKKKKEETERRTEVIWSDIGNNKWSRRHLLMPFPNLNIILFNVSCSLPAMSAQSSWITLNLVHVQTHWQSNKHEGEREREDGEVLFEFGRSARNREIVRRKVMKVAAGKMVNEWEALRNTWERDDGRCRWRASCSVRYDQKGFLCEGVWRERVTAKGESTMEAQKKSKTQLKERLLAWPAPLIFIL